MCLPSAGDDDGLHQRGECASGARRRSERPGPLRSDPCTRRGPHRVPGHADGSGGPRRLRQRPRPQRSPAPPHRHPRGPRGRGGVPGPALGPGAPGRPRGRRSGRGPGRSRSGDGGASGASAENRSTLKYGVRGALGAH